METPEYYISWNNRKIKWRLEEHERPRNIDGSYSAKCYDCGKPYSAAGDCVISDEIWERISPTYFKGVGILCPGCMLERLHWLGISGINAVLY